MTTQLKKVKRREHILPVTRRLCLFLLVASLLSLLPACSASAGQDLSGTWYFATGQSGSSTVSVSGTLAFESSERYEDSHRIGGILTHSKGVYSVSGDTLKLVPDAGTGGPMTYTFALGEHQDKDGKKFTGLTLKGSSGLTFLLTKEKR